MSDPLKAGDVVETDRGPGVVMDVYRDARGDLVDVKTDDDRGWYHIDRYGKLGEPLEEV